MFTQEEADHLVEIPKLITIKGSRRRAQVLKATVPFQTQCELISENGEYKFFLEINQSKKYSIKLSIHSNESDTKTGLLRVDYFGTHKNPEHVTNNLPEVFRNYAGKHFSWDDHHIHFYVEGYKPLTWALPLAVVGFSPITIGNQDDVQTSILQFARRINIITEISFQESLPL